MALPTDRVDAGAEFVSAPAIAEVARAAESAGFSACNVTDHPFPPGAWVDGGGHHALDPWVALSFAAAATTVLRLHTNVLIAAYRNPFLTAKAAATLDALSGGRLILGVGAGYLKEEFAALGVPFENRGRRLDATLEAVVRAWSGTPIRSEGPGWSADGNVMLPMPESLPHPPIWIGGNSPAARSRVVRLGQGWMPFPAGRALAAATGTTPLRDVEEVAQAIEGLRSELSEAGRTDPVDVCCPLFTQRFSDRAPIDHAAVRDEVARLAAAGATWITVFLPAADRRALLGAIAAFGREVISAP
ncbi:LLM class F420-dependent oxidoreductase [Actinocorallia populi]|uniref:LLM class F420-dependent oxidoreductase n=1 Tax=Actinocorallia populi TaxID=2079200 RepID=UPI0018E5976E|nr:LLM class F420-dependent oxidoreductase [Actinocorallia populi]